MWKRVNRIGRLCEEDRILTVKSNIEAHVFSHFRKLFGENSLERITMRIISNEGVKKAIWDLREDKAPGPYGFHIFFKKLWNLMEPDIMCLMREVYDGMARLDCLNYSHVVLIPKKDVPDMIGDYRSIALLNNTLKIVSKVLANSLVGEMDKLIGEYQTGFVVGRNIMEGAATA